MSKTAHLSFLKPFATYVRSLGVDPAPIAQELHLPDPETDAVAWLHPQDVHAYCDEAARRTQDPDLGLNAALARRTGSFGLVEFGARCAADLRAAMRFRTRYAALLREPTETFAEEDATEARYGFLGRGDELGLGRHAHEFRVVSGVSIIRGGMGPAWRPSRAWFSHGEPPSRRALIQALGTEDLRFQQSDNGVALPLSDLERPQLTANAELFDYLERQAFRAQQRPRDTALASELRGRLQAQLAAGGPDMLDLARQMHMSARTLHRRLAAQGVTFQGLLDQLRKELAEREVAQSQLSSEEIARRLGYSNPTAFLRAFKRWSGTSPTEYRRMVRNDAAPRQ